MQVLDPRTNKPILDEKSKEPVTLMLIGMDSADVQQKRKALGDRRVNALGQRKMMISADDLENDNMELLTACTKEWKHIVYNQKELPCTPENVKLIYTECPWIREQAEMFVNNRANFLGNS